MRPNVEFGKPFPTEPYAVVNAPVDVVVNGQEIAATNKIGMPGQVNQYRVDVLLPAGLPAGQTTLRVRAAFLDGTVFSIPVRQ